MPSRNWKRAMVLGLPLGVASVFGAGCQTDAPPDLGPHARPLAQDYPHLNVGGRRHAASVEREPSEIQAVQRSGSRSVDSEFATLATASSNNPLGAREGEETIDLGVALRLAGVENPTINLARERVREAAAQQLSARALLLPNLNVGGNFYSHGGALQASSGRIRDVDRQSLYMGLGGRAVGTGTVTFPGLWLFAHLGDAAYEPLAARQRVTMRQFDSQSVQNEVLLEVAVAYLELVGAETRRDAFRRGETELAEVVRLTAVYAEKGQGLHSDANRAATNLELLRRQLRETEEDVAVASARLCRLLSLDPSVRLRSPGGTAEVLKLIPENTELDKLVAEAVRARPEVVARSAAIQEAQARVRQERVRPLLPILSVGVSSGLFGGGSDLAASEFGPLKGRTDFDVLAVWNVQNLGLGNRAQVRRASAVMGQTIAEFDQEVNRIRSEVAESQADAQAAAVQIETAKAAQIAAEEGFKLEVQRIRDGFGRGPIEALDSFRQLIDARQETIRATIAFDVAQFRLFVAVGNTPSR